MTKLTKIAYEPHPVTPARKAELKAQGFRILDIRFKPKDDARIAVGGVSSASIVPPPPPEPMPAPVSAKPQLTLPGNKKH